MADLDLDALEQDARSAFILHEHKSNRYYFDERGRVGNEPVGFYGYRDRLLAEDFLALIERVRKAEAETKALNDIMIAGSQKDKARLQKLERVRGAANELQGAIDFPDETAPEQSTNRVIVARNELRAALASLEDK